MLLIDVKKYICQQQQVSLFALTQHFNVQPDILRDLLSVLVRKGQVTCTQKTPSCGTRCQSCDVLTTEIYQWTPSPQCYYVDDKS